jgi:hypothetical protein
MNEASHYSLCVFYTTSAVFFSERTIFSSHNKSSAAAKFQQKKQGLSMLGCTWTALHTM